MKLKEVIENLKYLISDDCTDNQMDFVEEIEMAINVLEKQIPKKPYIDNENGVYEKEHCPTCHRSLFPNDHHCRCGQALDWNDHPTEKGGEGK